MAALKPDTGMAFILVQHLDPTHESLMVDLLAGATALTVVQAAHGMVVEPNHLYIIPPGYYLAVVEGELRLSNPGARHGARMPFDFLLYSLAEAYGARAICIVLSGTGADGSAGLAAVSAAGGLVIAQDPDEASYDGMPRSADMTGLVRFVLPAAEIPSVLIEHSAKAETRRDDFKSPSLAEKERQLHQIIELVRAETFHNFALYKQGTLERRINRRMGLAGCEGDFDRYLDYLRDVPGEIELLDKDLLIHVTGFFRDPGVFEYLAEKVIPELVESAGPAQPIRIWSAGCSTGEETYSLAMLFREKMSMMKSTAKLQVFASDIDQEAISQAREGLYPETIAEEIAPSRLARFFIHEEDGYRVTPELRDSVLFTVQDVLTDPPFSRLDMISCRNLLIYLRPEAQAQIIAQFHFALRMGGILLLGNSEAIGKDDIRFGVVSKPQRIYSHIGHRRPGEFGLVLNAGKGMQPHGVLGPATTVNRQEVLADLCQRLVLEKYAPAAILINTLNECLYSIGPTEKYLQMAPGYPTHDLLAMVRREVRTKLRSAIQLAKQKASKITIAGNHRGDEALQFSIVVEPILNDGEELMLVCFFDKPMQGALQNLPVTRQEKTRVAELERELDSTRFELEGAILNLENSSQEQKSINQEVLSINEEYQSTNEELITSKEELQSLNEELTALNSQLHETLERQRTTSNDLQNILYSTNVATLFLDRKLCIRFFTPATKSLLNILSGDIGRPIIDLSIAASDTQLEADSRTVIDTHEPLEREILFWGNKWYSRRILPYRTEGEGVEGVVVTFNDITDRKEVAKALNTAMMRADSANVAKTRFLAAASHDLRQPLQTFALIQGILARTVKDASAQKLITRLDETLGAMSGMLNALLDINEIEAGTLKAEKTSFPINELIDRMRDEFGYHAEAKGLTFRTVACGKVVCSDQQLLEQMVRNLLTNALKYTGSGKILFGCRRHAESLSIEVLDTGIGIAADQLEAIFNEYHQIGNEARVRDQGLGLGLAIVQRFGDLLGHRLEARSLPGRGSVFSIEVPLSSDVAEIDTAKRVEEQTALDPLAKVATILIVDDDVEVRELLDLLLSSEGYRCITAEDGPTALALHLAERDRPDLVLADFNLPNRINGLDLVQTIRERLGENVPAILLTGDISTETLRDVATMNCRYLSKPIKTMELSRNISVALTGQRDPVPLNATRDAGAMTAAPGSPTVYVVDDDPLIRDAVQTALETEGRTAVAFSNCEDFLAAYQPGPDTCLLVDSKLPGMQGLELLQKLRSDGDGLPAIMITGVGDVATAVKAMKAGAQDFIEKPIAGDDLVASIEQALARSRDTAAYKTWKKDAAAHLARLTPRQRDVLDLVLAGHPSKNIAADLGISQRTVENHRAAIMKKTGVKSLPALARLAAAAEGPENGMDDDPSAKVKRWGD